MKFKLRLFLSGLFFLLCATQVFAAKRYWVAAHDSIWRSTRNWSATSGGAFGASIPGSNDTAYFNASSVKTNTFDTAVSVRRIEIASGYTGTIIQGVRSFTIGAGGATLSGGTFSGGSGSINVNGNMTISGTAFTSTSGTFITSKNLVLTSGSFTHNSGLVKFAAIATITGNMTFYQLEFAPSAASTYTISSGTTLTVNNTFTISGSDAATLNTGTINAKGNITLSNTANGGGGTATLVINGTVNQTMTGGALGATVRLPNVTINKSSDTLKLVNIIPVAGNWTWTAGLIKAGTSTVQFVGTKTITGTHTLYGVRFGSASTFTIASGTTLTVGGPLDYGTSAGAIIVNTGTLNLRGNINLDNPSTGGGGTASFVIDGTGSQTINGTSVNGYSALPNVTINKSSGTLTLDSTISVTGGWTYTAGTIAPGTSTLYFLTAKTITGTHTLNNITFDGSATSTYTIASGTTVTANGTLSVNGTAAVTLNTGTINAKGNITTSNTSSSGGGSATININGTTNQTFTGTGTASQGKFPKISIDKSGTTDTLKLASTISVANDWTYTQGIVNASKFTSTVAFYGPLNVDGQGTGSTMQFFNVTVASGTVTLTGNVTLKNNLGILSSATLSAGSNTLTVGGRWGNAGGTFTYGTSTVVLNGGGFNILSRTSGGLAATETFYNLTFNRPSGSQTFNSPVTVNNVLTLTKGHVKTTGSNYLLLIDNATVSGGSDSAYVHGPVRKTGNDAFVFPLGDTTLTDSSAYHPLAMSAPSSTGDQFEATYFAHASSYAGGALEDTLEAVSNCEYWTCDRKAGSSTVTISLGWNNNSCRTTGTEEMTIAEWSGAQWVPINSAVTAYSGPTGTLQTTAPVSVGTPVHYVIASRKLRTVYVPSRPQLDGFTTRSFAKVLYVIYDEKYLAGNLNYTIYDMANTPFSTSSSPITKQYGRNWLKINLAPVPGLIINQYYVIEIQNEKGQKEFVRFCLK